MNIIIYLQWCTFPPQKNIPIWERAIGKDVTSGMVRGRGMTEIGENSTVMRTCMIEGTPESMSQVSTVMLGVQCISEVTGSSK